MKTIALLAAVCALATLVNAVKVVFIPLDERFTTRDIFLNMAKITPYEVVTPPFEYLSHIKQPANNEALHRWISQEVVNSDFLIISSELFMYGGLIQSRISNETIDTIMKRFDDIKSYKKNHPKLKIYLSNVVMRIPQYNDNFEEPNYWASYGYDLWAYSFYLDRYNMLHNETDLLQANDFKAKVPTPVLTEFLWRRQRNHNVTMNMLQAQKDTNLFEKIYITLDDSAEYGLNKAEERELRATISDKNLWGCMYMYPGADEVALAMLANAAVRSFWIPTNLIRIVYRVPKTKDYIAKYDGQALSKSVEDQVQASGGLIVTDDYYDVLIVVNNFDTIPQQEAPDPQSPGNYTSLIPYISQAIDKKKVVVFADVRFCNGGDVFFLQWIYELQNRPKFGLFTYAGWNTAGNTLGTCISNGVLVSLFTSARGDKKTKDNQVIAVNDASLYANQIFTLYRFLEDTRYQAIVRGYLYSYLFYVAVQGLNTVDTDPMFYTNFVTKGLMSHLEQDIKPRFPETVGISVTDLYFPWGRPFEIGFTIVKN